VITVPAWAPTAAAALALAAAVGVVGWSYRATYSAGFDSGKAAGDAILQTAYRKAEGERADALRALSLANARAAAIESDASRRIAEVEKNAIARSQTVKESNRANPSFASLRRPADVERVRDDQLAELERAARRSADLSATSLRGLPGPGPSAGSEHGGE
jgi:hypothetical protein